MCCQTTQRAAVCLLVFSNMISQSGLGFFFLPVYDAVGLGTLLSIITKSILKQLPFPEQTETFTMVKFPNTGNFCIIRNNCSTR